jgi:hypothetical protein
MLSCLNMQSLGRYAPVYFLKHGEQVQTYSSNWRACSSSQTLGMHLWNLPVATFQNSFREQELSLSTHQEIETGGIGAFQPIVLAPQTFSTSFQREIKATYGDDPESWPFTAMPAIAPYWERKENDFRRFLCGCIILLLHENSARCCLVFTGESSKPAEKLAMPSSKLALKLDSNFFRFEDHCGSW